MKKIFLLFAVVVQFFLIDAQVQKSYSSAELLLQLKKCNTVGSVLYIAAHPDDENTRLIAWLANEKCLRTAYLSLTRGDGGQNLIGPEQGVELGMIRTQELLAARRVDGGEQYFTRAYDFGYSKTPKETFEKWNHDTILADVVWAIRNFKPDVIITRFATDGSGGHGHHTASAILAEEAFDAAGDPTKFPEQLKNGVEVWKPKRLFWNVSTRFQNPNADMSAYLKEDVGGYNELLGKSYGEIAAESRSMHKSQGFGSARQRGEYYEYFKPIKGDTVGLNGIFSGMDFTWNLVKGKESIGKQLDDIIKSFNPQKPLSSLPSLLNVREELNGYHAQLCDKIIEQISGIYIEYVAELPNATLKDSIKINLNAIMRTSEFGEFAVWKLSHPVSRNNRSLGIIDASGCNANCEHVNISANRLLTQKYTGFTRKLYEDQWFYSKGIQRNFYVPYDFLQRHLPEPINQSELSVKLSLREFETTINRSLSYKWVNPEKGELYRQVVAVPPVLIQMNNDVMVFGDDKPRKIILSLKSTRDAVKGELKIPVPRGWSIEYENGNKGKLAASSEFRYMIDLLKKGDVKEVVLMVKPLTNASETEVTFTAVIDGENCAIGMKEIKYDHIPVLTRFIPATVKLVPVALQHRMKQIGYIEGAGDEVKTCLEQIGYTVTMLTNAMLASDDLSKYDAIVTGVRAYNTNDQLSDYKRRLMDYVAAGGNLIVQYNTNSFAGPLKADIGPYPFKITRDRITDENATVTFTMPEHPIFNTPNKITSTDFNGWIQERSIYHAGTWDSSYVAPITMNDPGEKSNAGALLIGKHGKGNFIYTGLVFFRELPAGVPGAYRLMVNLIELGKEGR